MLTLRCPLCLISGFYNEHGYLPSPHISPAAWRALRGALRLYGIEDGVTKIDLSRYVKHARLVFGTHIASVVIPTEDESLKYRSIRAGTTGESIDGTGKAHRAAQKETIMDHIMMMRHDRILVIEDLRNDWRFAQTPFTLDGATRLRFFAGVPLSVAVAIGNSDKMQRVTIGALFVADPEPSTFDSDKAALLRDIASMAHEALEAEFHSNVRRKQEKMQAMFSDLSDLLSSTSFRSDADSLNTTAPHKGQADMTVKVIADCLDATATVIDVTNFSQPPARVRVQHRSKSSFGIGSPSSQDTGSHGRPQQSPQPYAQPEAQSASSVSSKSTDTAMSSPVTSDSARNQLPTFGQTKSEAIPAGPDQYASLHQADAWFVDPSYRAHIFAQEGPLRTLTVDGPRQRAAIAHLLARFHQEREHDASTAVDQIGGPYFTEVSPTLEESDSASGEERDPETDDLDRSPLAPLFADVADAGSYVVVPVSRDILRARATFLLVVAFSEARLVTRAETAFIHHCARLLVASLTRQRANLAESRQLDFVRSVQHEMRTPINGIAGMAELLRASIDRDDAEISTHQDGFLSIAVDDIRMSASNLSNVLDDILDFGDLTGLRAHGSRPPRLDETDLTTLIEDVGLEELEIATIALRHSTVGTSESTKAIPPRFFISIHDDARGCFRVDRSSTRKICRKLLHNCFRFSTPDTKPDPLVEVKVRLASPREVLTPGNEVEVVMEFCDNGRGMSKAFVDHKYGTSFEKEDTFRQGTGLGGAIASNLTRRLGGTFDVRSELGKGTEVTVTLPLVFVSEAEDEAAPANKTSSAPESSVGTLKASFCAFGTSLGEQRVRTVFCDLFRSLGVKIVDFAEAADLLVAPVTAFEDQTLEHLLPLTSRQRIIVVTADPLQRCTHLARFIATPYKIFRPPFGPTHVDGLRRWILDSNRNEAVSHSPVAALCAGSSSLQARNSDSAAAGEEQEPSPETSVVSLPQSEQPLRISETIGQPNLSPTAAEEGLAIPGPAIPLPLQEDFRVLAVEDNPTNMKILTVVLRRQGLNYREARDGREAIAKFKTFLPHLILLDISLPYVDGFGVCEAIKAMDLEHHPRIIAVTALSSKADQERGLNMGFHEWWNKPLSPRMLVQRLKEWKAAWLAQSVTSSPAVSPSETVQGEQQTLGAPSIEGTT